MDEELDLVGDTTVPEDEEEEVRETDTEEKAPADEEETHDDEEQEEEEPKKEDNTHKALDSERARRKAAEKRLKELEASIQAEKDKKEDEEAYLKKREDIKKKLVENEIMGDEVADTILEALADDLIKSQISNERRNKELDFDNNFAEFKKDELFMDADVYKPEIKELMKKGLSMEQAYFASAGKSRFSQMKKDMEVEIEQKLLNTERKADEVDIGHIEDKNAVKRTKYTKREQEIAKETGLTVEEVHKRSGMFSIEDLENL